MGWLLELAATGALMPTGYTANINATTTLRSFALRCAREFLVEMREEDFDAELPDARPPAKNYAEERVASLERRYEQLRAMKPADCDGEASREYVSACSSRAEARLRIASVEANLRRLLAEVEAWKPPTKEHHGLAQFMRQQLEETIEHDCRPRTFDPEPTRLSADEWRGRELDRVSRMLVDARKDAERERSHRADSDRWIKALRASLPPEAP